jgi:hypothetical protein
MAAFASPCKAMVSMRGRSSSTGLPSNSARRAVPPGYPCAGACIAIIDPYQCASPAGIYADIDSIEARSWRKAMPFGNVAYFLVWAALIFLMMRYGCGAHVMGHRHGC